MSHKKERCNCKQPNKTLMARAKSAFLDLVPVTPQKGYAKMKLTGCELCSPLMSERSNGGLIPPRSYDSYADVLRDLEENECEARYAKRANTVRREICRYIWGDELGRVLKDWEGIMVERVYAKLKLDNSPVVVYFEQNGPCDMTKLPYNLKRLLDGAISMHAPHYEPEEF
ncbi:hypothetical protein F5Y09DRAFT_345020 [Xylaria sp. FL1042]|nr:hypothetical protein F5Y09DRAFT_345020 [Xylaria sp. FL1042]